MPVLQKNDRVGEGLNLQRWRVARKVGEGQFAEVYEVADTFHGDRKLALKLDRLLEVNTVEREAKALKRLQPCPCVVRLLEQGAHEGRGFMVMELLGMNVADSRKSCTKDGKWDAPIARAIGRHLLDAIAGMHQLGYIHRDIKPANFAITPRFAAVHEGAWHVIDFGLARRYVDEAGLVMEAREDAAFRGSTTYASLAAHDGEDLGRRDDLWSWLYIMVEMITGTLPWRSDDRERDREQVVRLKRECQGNPAKLAGSGGRLPAALARVSDHLVGLNFKEDPDYAFLRRCLDDLVAEAAPAQPNGVAGSHLTGLEDIADTPLSPPDEIADTPLSPPGDIADTPLSPPSESVAQPAARPAASVPASMDLSSGMALPVRAMASPAYDSTAGGGSRAAAGALAGAKRPRPDEARSPAKRDDRSRSREREADRHARPRLEAANGAARRAESRERGGSPPRSRPGSRGRSRSRSVSPAAAGRGREPSRGRDPDSPHRGRTPERLRARAWADDRGRSRDRSRERSPRGRSRERDRDPYRGRASADRDVRGGYRGAGAARGDSSERERARRLSERERAGEAVRDSDRGRYRDSVSARRDERPTSVRPGNGELQDGYQMDTSKCKHVHKYVTRIKQGEMSEGARDCKAQLKLISLTEGLGLAAYVIDNIVDEVSSRDAEQMAELLGELEDYVWSQRQRAKHRARRR